MVRKAKMATLNAMSEKQLDQRLQQLLKEAKKIKKQMKIVDERTKRLWRAGKLKRRPFETKEWKNLADRNNTVRDEWDKTQKAKRKKKK